MAGDGRRDGKSKGNIMFSLFTNATRDLVKRERVFGLCVNLC